MIMNSVIKETKWNLFEPNSGLREKLSTELGISSITAQIMINRGLKTHSIANSFINSSLKSFHDPFCMKDMEIAVKRIFQAIDSKEKIYIFGDYDVDGITATSLLILFFREIGVKADFYIPDRIKEGYGPNEEAIKNIYNAGGRLLITVDCGISAINEVKLANELGLDVIVTDHHNISGAVPEAVAILHPGQAECSYPFKSLAGVGVVFKLVKSLRRHMLSRGVASEKLPNLRKYLDIVSIGTIADIVPLLDENHIIAKFGLKESTRTGNIGLKALKAVTNISGREMTAYDIGYTIAPRINAAGRMGDASVGVNLLTTDNPKEAGRIAELLDNENRKRQRIQSRIHKDALNMINGIDLEKEKAIILASQDWHPGVIGIVASKLAEEFFKPTILLNMDGNIVKGSARSIPSFHLYDSLEKCKDLLIEFGGHKYAAGLAVHKDMLGEFKERFNKITSDSLNELTSIQHINIDMLVSLSDMDMDAVKDMQKLAPFGCSNSAPLLCATGVRFVGEPYYMGKRGDHVRVDIEENDEVIQLVGFNSKRIFESLPPCDKGYDVVFTPEINVYGNIVRVQLRLKDIKPTEKSLLPTISYI